MAIRRESRFYHRRMMALKIRTLHKRRSECGTRALLGMTAIRRPLDAKGERNKREISAPGERDPELLVSRSRKFKLTQLDRDILLG